MSSYLRAEDFYAYEVLQSIVSAAWYKIVFQDGLPWNSPREIIRALQDIKPLMRDGPGTYCKYYQFIQLGSS